MITTVTLNPAIDKTYRAARLIPGQVNRMDSMKQIAGGKGINVAKVLRGYGFPVQAMGFLGGYPGVFLKQQVEKTGIKCFFTAIEQDTRSSMNILSEDGYVTEILEPGPVISGQELDQFLKDYEKALSESELLVLSGSVPGGVPEDIYGCLIEAAKQAGKRVILDSSGPFLKEGVKKRPFLIKPNLKELEILTGKKLRDRSEVVRAARALCEGGVSMTAVSMGEKGLLLAAGERVLFARVPKVKAVNTVGCGDSAVAAFAMALIKGAEEKEALLLAAAVSAANATTMENGEVPREEADRLIKEIQVEEWKA